MVELSWALGGEDMGVQPCDGMICASPAGSTAYNLSNGGPVLARGLDAMVVTFIAPHSLHARPLVVPRGIDLEIRNQTLDVDVTVLVDGHLLTDVGHGSPISIRLANSEASSPRSPRPPSSGATGTPSAPDSRPGSGADTCGTPGLGSTPGEGGGVSRG